MNMEERLQAVVSQAETDGKLWHDIVHGDETASVETQSGEVPSIAKQLKDIRDKITGGVLDVVQAAETARDETLELKTSTETLRNETQQLRNETEELKNQTAALKTSSEEIFNSIEATTNLSLETLQTTTEQHIQTIQSTGEQEVSEVVSNGTEQINLAKNEAERAKSYANEAKQIVDAQLSTIYQNSNQIISGNEIILDKKISKYIKELNGTIWEPSINVSQLNANYSVTFELYLIMNTVTAINWTTHINIQWLSGDLPDLSQTKRYLLVLRSDDAGQTWFGNLQGFLEL